MQHLADLAGVHFGGAEVLRNPNLDIRAGSRAHQSDRLPYKPGNRHQPPDRRAPFGKGQQL